jgi:hypothetical protein
MDVLETARAGLLGSESKAPDHAARMILLTDLLIAAMNNPGCGWIRRHSATPSRPNGHLWTDLDGWNLATDQKAGGSSPSEHARPEATYDHERAFTDAKAVHITLRTSHRWRWPPPGAMPLSLV